MHQGRTGGLKPKEIDLELLEHLAAEGLGPILISKKLGIASTTFYRRLEKDAVFKEAYERGRAARSKAEPEERQPPIRRKIERVGPETRPSTIVMEIEEAAQITEVPAARQEPHKCEPGIIITDARQKVHSRFITMGDGSQLVVGFEGNIFTLTQEERVLLGQIADLLQGHETGVKL